MTNRLVRWLLNWYFERSTRGVSGERFQDPQPPVPQFAGVQGSEREA